LHEGLAWDVDYGSCVAKFGIILVGSPGQFCGILNVFSDVEYGFRATVPYVGEGKREEVVGLLYVEAFQLMRSYP
jgi:hypothetical protein